MTVADRERWDRKYADRTVPEHLQPDPWLAEHAGPLPTGRALELACGLGHNALWLAERGWQVDAVDVSPAGLALAARWGTRLDLEVNWIAGDLDEFVPPAHAYDLVLVFRFLDRQRWPAVIPTLLRPGGRLIYETFCRDPRGGTAGHVRNPAYTLEPGELTRLFPGVRTLQYQEATTAEGYVSRFVGEARDTAGRVAVQGELD